MHRHQVRFSNPNAPALRGQDEGFPIPYVDAASVLHDTGMIAPDADRLAEGGGAAKGGNEFRYGLYRSHAVDVTHGNAIRQHTLSRSLCDVSGMKRDDSKKMPRDMTFSERLRWAREHAGFESAEDAASALGMNPGTYRSHERVENGRTPKDDHVMELYARRFKVNLMWLAYGKGSPDLKSGDAAPQSEGAESAGAERAPHGDPDFNQLPPRRDSQVMSIAAQAATEALLTEWGMPADVARNAVAAIVQFAESSRQFADREGHARQLMSSFLNPAHPPPRKK